MGKSICMDPKKQTNTSKHHKNKNTHSERDNYTADKILSTVDINMESIKDWEILDSGATSHFLVTAAPITNITPESNPLTVKLPYGACVSSTHTCTLNLTQLPTRAREGHIIPGLTSRSLMSVIKPCKAGCEVTFTKIYCEVKHLGRIILRGSKCTRKVLWMIKLDNTAKITPESINP